MKVYHLTKSRYLSSMRVNGIRPHSFWGDFDIVIHLMSSEEDETIISANTERNNFVVNYEVAELYKNLGYIKEISDENDYKAGFLQCNELICDEIIYEFEVVDKTDYHRLLNEAFDYKITMAN